MQAHERIMATIKPQLGLYWYVDGVSLVADTLHVQGVVGMLAKLCTFQAQHIHKFDTSSTAFSLESTAARREANTWTADFSAILVCCSTPVLAASTASNAPCTFANLQRKRRIVRSATPVTPLKRGIEAADLRAHFSMADARETVHLEPAFVDARFHRMSTKVQSGSPMHRWFLHLSVSVH